MNAIELLKRQHREVEKLFGEFEKLGEGKHAQKEDLFVRIADALAAHASIEEKYFYPAVNDEKTEDILLESAEEHLGMKRVIADLLDLAPTDETFDAKVKVLQELVDHHVGEEEKQLMPKVQKMIDKQALEDLGLQMEQEYLSLREGEPRANVPAETDHAPSIN